MLKWIKKLYEPKQTYICGGDGYCEIQDLLGRPIAWIWYNRPTSSLKLDYLYQAQKRLVQDNQEKLKKIEKEKDETRRTSQTHELIINELCIPYAQKVFVRSKGYMIDGKPVESFSKDDQFEYIKTHFSNHLEDLVALVFVREGVVKKKT